MPDLPHLPKGHRCLVTGVAEVGVVGETVITTGKTSISEVVMGDCQPQ